MFAPTPALKNVALFYITTLSANVDLSGYDVEQKMEEKILSDLQEHLFILNEQLVSNIT